MSKDLSRQPLFIAPRESDIGVIVEAEIRRTKVTKAKYIWLRVNLNEIDNDVGCVLGRMGYTLYVIKHNLPKAEEAEEANVATLIGCFARIRFDAPQVALNDQLFHRLNVLNIWRPL